MSVTIVGIPAGQTAKQILNKIKSRNIKPKTPTLDFKYFYTHMVVNFKKKNLSRLDEIYPYIRCIQDGHEYMGFNYTVDGIDYIVDYNKGWGIFKDDGECDGERNVDHILKDDNIGYIAQFFEKKMPGKNYWI